MIKLEFTTAEREALQYWRFHHPHPRVQLKMEALYLKSQGLAPEEISRLCSISTPTFYRYLHQYRVGGLAKLKEVHLHPRHNGLADHRASLEASFRQHPVASVAEAATRIEELTGLQRGPTQVRQFLKSLGMKPRKVGQIPAKADVAEQERFTTEDLEPRLAEAQAGQRVVFFLDAAHFVYAPFLGLVWCFERLFIKAPSGRQRLNVLAALNATTREIFTVRNLTYITAATVCELLGLLAGAYPGVPLTIVLDNARYQRCALVQNLAESLGIELLFLPAYSPNLNLIERFWKFVKKKCLYSKYYADHISFQQAILECIEQAPNKYKVELESLLTLKFQTFKEVSVIGEESNVCLFPVAKQTQRKVSSKAA
ncbi:MAG: IS630 family transposase [Acidobacteria bacterium]|nr:IS630 family transposase [Acidobacteriota bacterium]